MKKLKLNKWQGIACFILLCLLLVQGCKKDRMPFPALETNKITDQAIDNWYKENPISQILPLNWKKARQATIDGSHIIRVPTLNQDLIKKLQYSENKALKGNVISSHGLAKGIKGKIGVEQNPNPVDDTSGNNPNYFSAHPPEIYFVQPAGENKLYTFLFNFAPDNTSSGFGQNGMWSGKLYEWSLSSDTVLVQTFTNNLLADRYIQQYYRTNAEGGIEFNRPEKLQSLGSLKDKQVSGIFGWLADKIADGLGAIGYLFGLTELVPSTGSSSGHHNHYRFVSHPSNSSGSPWGDIGNNGDAYVGAGLPIVSSFLSSMDYTGMPETEVTYSSYNYGGAYQSGGPNNNPVPNENGIYIMEYLYLSAAAQDYILSAEAIPLTKLLRDYLDANGWTIENREFVSWLVEYMNVNTSMNINDFKNRFLTNTSQYKIDSYIRTKYPKFASIADGLIFFLSNNPKVIDALSLYSGFDKNEILELVTNGNGPSIQLSNEPWTQIGNGLFNYKISSNTIFLPEENVAYFENNIGSANVKNSLAFSLMITILHETVHYGRFKNGKIDPAAMHDYGTRFEELGFGFNVEFQINQPVYYKLYYLPL